MIYTKDNPKFIDMYYDFEEIDTPFTGVVKDKENTIVYYLNGQYHREDGPAIEFAGGSKEWWLNGKHHGYNDDYTNKSWIRFVKLELLK